MDGCNISSQMRPRVFWIISYRMHTVVYDLMQRIAECQPHEVSGCPISRVYKTVQASWVTMTRTGLERNCARIGSGFDRLCVIIQARTPMAAYVLVHSSKSHDHSSVVLFIHNRLSHKQK